MSETTLPTPNFDQITNSMLDLLDARSKDVIVRRFGLKKDDPETLESIGREYGITRERVRQIEANAKKTLSNLESLYRPIFGILHEIFEDHGGIMTEAHVLEVVREKTRQEIQPNTIAFYLVILPQFTLDSASKVFAPHWRHTPAIQKSMDAIVAAATQILEEAKQPFTSTDFFAQIKQELGEAQALVTDKMIRAALNASAKIDATVFDEWGLAKWAEIHPRGVGDKAYAVLRRHGKPAHFREITQLINRSHFDHKTANAQTVHNELIKDKRFVLVGRGLYGLKEWGYMSGTVADVLEAILKDASTPLTSDQLINQVLKQRIVKKNTILLSLQNGKRFQKTGAGYTLR